MTTRNFHTIAIDQNSRMVGLSTGTEKEVLEWTAQHLSTEAYRYKQVFLVAPSISPFELHYEPPSSVGKLIILQGTCGPTIR